jgi:hypothetical protein
MDLYINIAPSGFQGLVKSSMVMILFLFLHIKSPNYTFELLLHPPLIGWGLGFWGAIRN